MSHLKEKLVVWTEAIEVRLAIGFGAVWLVGLALGLPANVPESHSLEFVQRHYFSPLLLAFALQIPVVWLAGKRGQSDPLLLLKLLPFLMLVVFLHFNFKAWMPLVNARLYDELYQGIDEAAAPVVQLFLAIRHLVAAVVPDTLEDGAYHHFFVGAFFVSLAAHALFDTPARQRQLVLGLCLILLLGGVLYWAAPAVGPFLYRAGPNAECRDAQRHMLALFGQVLHSGRLPDGYFTAPLAAMPSLHVAHMLFLTLFARPLRWLYLLYLPALCWIVVESVASGWHYLADLPPGMALAVICYLLVPQLAPEPACPRQPVIPEPEPAAAPA